MMFLSKGILPWEPSQTSISVSHCGALYKLIGTQAVLWLTGRHEPGHTRNAGQDAALETLAALGIAERSDSAEDAALSVC